MVEKSLVLCKQIPSVKSHLICLEVEMAFASECVDYKAKYCLAALRAEHVEHDMCMFKDWYAIHVLVVASTVLVFVFSCDLFIYLQSCAVNCTLHIVSVFQLGKYMPIRTRFVSATIKRGCVRLMEKLATCRPS